MLRPSIPFLVALAGLWVAAPAQAATPAPPAPPAASAAASSAPVVEIPVVDAVTAPAGAPAPAPAQTSTAAAAALPPMSFFASVAGDELLEGVKAAPAFAKLEKDLPGSPIQLRVTHSLQPTAGGQAAGLLSAIWAGSTLGLLPVVTNNNLVLVYEVRVNGHDIVRYDFQRSFTRAIGIWGSAKDPTYGLGEEGLEWARSTAAEFAAKAAQDPALLELGREYAFYFGGEAGATAH